MPERSLVEQAEDALRVHREDCDYCAHAAHCVVAYAYHKAIGWLQDARIAELMRERRARA